MTPHAPVSDHAEPTVPDGSDFPPRPSLQALSQTAAGTKQQGERGRAGHPTGYVGTEGGDEPPESGARLRPPPTVYLHHPSPPWSVLRVP